MCNRIFFGEKCDICSPLGVSCVISALFNREPTAIGLRVIKIDGIPRLRTFTPISECGAVLEPTSRAKVVADLRSKVDESSHYLILV